MSAHTAEAVDLIRNRPGFAREVARQLRFAMNRRGLVTKPALSKLGMTRRQAELLEFVRDYYNANGVMPSYDEMRDGVGLRSKSGIHRLVLGLEERGHLFRLPNRARSIVLADA